MKTLIIWVENQKKNYWKTKLKYAEDYYTKDGKILTEYLDDYRSIQEGYYKWQEDRDKELENNKIKVLENIKDKYKEIYSDIVDELEKEKSDVLDGLESQHESIVESLEDEKR